MSSFIERDVMFNPWTTDAPRGHYSVAALSPAERCRKNAIMRLCLAVRQSQPQPVPAVLASIPEVPEQPEAVQAVPDSPVLAVRRIESFRVV